MILHAASIAAFFVDQLAQAPVQIQCVQQTAPESFWKSLLQIAQTIIPVAGGVLIAWMAFRWNSKKEHERWVRDQKKAEWRELVTHIAVIEKELPIILSGVQKYETLEPTVLAIDASLHNTLFIWSNLQSSGFVVRWRSFVAYVSGQFLSAVHSNNCATNQMLADQLDIDTQQRIEQDWLKNEHEIRQRLSGLLNDLRTIAHDDMGTQTIA